jgi:hypothetical protein
MRNTLRVLATTLMVFLLSCADHGTPYPVTTGGEEQGSIAFRMLKSDTPADAWVIEARLERDGFATLKQSVLVRTSSDTIKITMSGIAIGYWKITVEARDSTGTIRYAGTTSVQIIEGQTVQALVRMNPTGSTGNLEISVLWPSSPSHLQVRVSGSYFLMHQALPVMITNVSNETVNPDMCCARPDLRVQQKVNGTWTPPGACELMCPSILLPLKPGQRIVDSVLQIAQPGLYRLMLRYRPDTQQGSALVCESYSNEFNVVGVRKGSARIGEEFALG